MSAAFKVGEVEVGGGSLFLIAGPCVIESEEHALKMAEAIADIARSKNLPLHLQGVLRQGQPNLDQELSRTGPGRRHAHPPQSAPRR